MLSVQWLASRQRCCSSVSCDSNPHSLGRRARSVIPVTSCVTSVTLRSFSKPLCHRDFPVAFVVIFSLSLLGIVAGVGFSVKGRIGLFAWHHIFTIDSRLSLKGFLWYKTLQHGSKILLASEKTDCFSPVIQRIERKRSVFATLNVRICLNAESSLLKVSWCWVFGAVWLAHS